VLDISRILGGPYCGQILGDHGADVLNRFKAAPADTHWYYAAIADIAVARLDGVEVAHPIIHARDGARREMMAFYERARRLNPDIAAIGSSDVHTTATLADCRTLVFVRDATRAGVIDAIRTGRTVAMDRNGALYGLPDLVPLVDASRPAGRVDPHPQLRRASAALAVAGLLGMMLLGARPARGPGLSCPP